MSHELESMAYVSNEANGRFVPWHGLGQAVDHAMTSAEAIEAAGLNWNVLSKPMFTEEGLLIPNHKANIRDSDNSVLGIVTDRYQIVQNRDAFDFTDALIGEGVKYETAGSLFNGKKIFLLASLPETKIIDDEVVPYICFTNSHDGFGAIQACCTPIRVCCNNTLNLALSQAKRKWSTKHVGDLSSKMAEAKHTLQLANDYMTELSHEAERLANISVTDAEIQKMLDELFPVTPEDSDRRKANVQELKDQFMVCMFAPDLLKFKGTAWQAVQAASDFATHISPKRAADSYRANNFNRVLDGHPIIDKVYDLVTAR